MAANIVCYYNLAHKQGISMVLPVVINKIEFFLDKTSRLSHKYSLFIRLLHQADFVYIDSQPCVTVMYDAGDGSGVCGGISVLL